MGNKASNSKMVKGEISKCDNFVHYGHLTMPKSDWKNKNNDNNHNNTAGDFLMMGAEDPKNWSPNELTPSKIMLLTSGFQCPKAPPPTTKQSDTTDSPLPSPQIHDPRNIRRLQLLSSSSMVTSDDDGRHYPSLHPSKIGDWDRLTMTSLLFPRTSHNNNYDNNTSQSGDEMGDDMMKLVDKKSSNLNHHRLCHKSKFDQGGDQPSSLIQKKSSSSPSSSPSSSSSVAAAAATAALQKNNNNYKPPPWLPNVRTSEAKTNLQKNKKSLKSSIFSFGQRRRKSSLQKISNLKFSLSKKSKQNIPNSRSLTFKKSLEKYVQNNNNSNSLANSRSRPPQQNSLADTAADMDTIVMVKGPPVVMTTTPGGRKDSRFFIKSSLVNSADNNSDSFEYTYEYTYSSNSSSVHTPEEDPNKKQKPEEEKKAVVSGSGGRTTTTTTSGTGTTNSKKRRGGGGGGKRLTGSELSKKTIYQSTPTYYGNSGESGVNSGQGSSTTTTGQKIRPRPKKKIPPPPVFINDYGSGLSTKKKQETPADRLKNVDIVEELCYNCPGDDDNDDGGDCCTCCTLDYYCCCNECGEVELVPQCCCTPCKKTKKSSSNPVKYCRRQRFNFDDGKDKNECSDGPPFCWEDRPSNLFDEIPVGKNPVLGVSCSGDGSSNSCCDPAVAAAAVVEKNCGTDNKQVLPSESGTYFFDAERRCFVPVVEVREPPPPPPPEVVDEIIDEEPILTNVELIIQPVIQPMDMGMGGGCGSCGPCGPCNPCGMPICGCPMSFFGSGGCGMMTGAAGSEGSAEDGKKKGKKSHKEKSGTEDTGQTMENLGMMGLCGMNMNGLANMGPYGTIAMPIMKYNHKPPTPPCMPPCPCGPCPCQPPYQPMSNCCNPVCFPGYPSCSYPMYCNPGGMCCNPKKKKKKKNKNSGENSSVQTSTTADASSGPTGSTRTRRNDEDDDD